MRKTYVRLSKSKKNGLTKTKTMNSTNATKRKMFIIATGMFLVTMSSVFFMMNDNKLDINHDEVKAFVLQENDADVPQDETFYRELLNNEKDDILVLSNESTVEVTSTEFHEVKDQNFFTLVHPDDIPEVGNALIEVTESDNSVGPVRLKASTGEYKPYVISMESVENEAGEKVSTALTLKDTSRAVGDRGNENETERDDKDNDNSKRVTDRDDRVTEKNDDRDSERDDRDSSNRKTKIKTKDRDSNDRDTSKRKEKPKKRKISSNDR